jgi:protein gp37
MSENRKIQWSERTCNPWEGCENIGPGRDHCYAEVRKTRFGGGIAIDRGMLDGRTHNEFPECQVWGAREI